MDNSLRNKMILWGWIDDGGRDLPWTYWRRFTPLQSRPRWDKGLPKTTPKITITKRGEYYWASFHASGMLVGGTALDPVEALSRARQLVMKRKPVTSYKPRLYYNG